VSVAAVVLAGGSGTRVGAERNKVLLPLAGETLLVHSVRRAAELPGISVVVVVVRPGDDADVAPVLDTAVPDVPVVTAPGGATRHASELSALQALRPRIEAGEVDVVAIHDAARPLASAALWAAVVGAAREHGGAIPVRPAAGVVEVDGLTGAPAGEAWVTVQTPQAFRAAPLLASYLAAERDDFQGTDTAACVAAYSELPVVPVPGEATNLKVTYAVDLTLAERLQHDT
jgi:2-C-methyl-D-erythritol 4-phosphate cytidylyltransferase